jgi:RNA polymerase sigma-70 factor (ECF subfamily)
MAQTPRPRRKAAMVTSGARGKRQEGAEDHLLEALRLGDEEVFAGLVDRHGASLYRVALAYLHDPVAAEDVVQETWLGLLESLDRFEGRASLKTWIFAILVNRARKRRQRESRAVALGGLEDAVAPEPTVAPERFAPATHHWAHPPRSWDGLPEEKLLSREMRAEIRRGIDSLPPAQRAVITLRDVEGWTPAEVRNVLEITETNQRVLLHRARAKLRQVLERYVTQQAEPD